MKNLLFITLTLTVILLSSCKKDEATTISDGLSGTTWQSGNLHCCGSPAEYRQLKFFSNSAVELSAKTSTSQPYVLLENGTYIKTGNNIEIKFLKEASMYGFFNNPDELKFPNSSSSDSYYKQ